MLTWPSGPDLILAGGAIPLIGILVKSLFSSPKPAWWLSLVISTVLTVYAGTFMYLKLPFNATTTEMQAVMWGVLTYQGWRAAHGPLPLLPGMSTTDGHTADVRSLT